MKLTVNSTEDYVCEDNRPAAIAFPPERVDTENDEACDGEYKDDDAEDLTDGPPR